MPNERPVERPVRPLVERLREMSRRGHWPLIGDEAADEIERLRAELQDFEADTACEDRCAALERIAHAAQALTVGATDTGADFVVPSHLMAALALALDEGPNAELTGASENVERSSDAERASR